jgi:hypothetical protein
MTSCLVGAWSNFGLRYLGEGMQPFQSSGAKPQAVSNTI